MLYLLEHDRALRVKFAHPGDNLNHPAPQGAHLIFPSSQSGKSLIPLPDQPKAPSGFGSQTILQLLH